MKFLGLFDIFKQVVEEEFLSTEVEAAEKEAHAWSQGEIGNNSGYSWHSNKNAQIE